MTFKVQTHTRADNLPFEWQVEYWMLTIGGLVED